MKALLLTLLLAAGAFPALAQRDAADQAERARIARERHEADTRLAAQEIACYKKFAVSDCLKAARAQRREVLADLRRQELTLNDADRKRRAGERMQSIEQSNAVQKEEEGGAQRAEAVARRHDREADAARRAAERAQTRGAAPARAARTQKDPAGGAQSTHTAGQPRTHDTAEGLRRYNERQSQAQERRDRVAKRLAEPARPEVKLLPVPP